MLKAPNKSPVRPGEWPPSAANPEQPDKVRSDAFVIDDEDGVCKFVSTALATLGLAVESFGTAQAALVALERGHPDIVFLDIALGGSDAIDVIRTLGEKRYSGSVQLMSGTKSALLDDVHRIGAFRGLNMCPPLEKPFRKEAIQRAVASLTLQYRPEVTISRAPPLHPGLDIALANGWLELWYQPKIDLRSGALAGVKGVIKYRHPTRGVHAIDGLLSTASSETLSALTEHSFLTALRDWDEFDRAGINVRTAVSAPIGALVNMDLVTLARQTRPKSDRWRGLILEISEHEVIEDVNVAHEIATQLRIYDVTLSIGNFGAGLASFERLRELPFSELVLHTGFVAGCATDTKNAGICRAAVGLAHRFGVVAVADGLENASDLRALQKMRCDSAQGPFLADPMPKSQCMAELRERQQTRKPWLR